MSLNNSTSQVQGEKGVNEPQSQAHSYCIMLQVHSSYKFDNDDSTNDC